MTVLYRYLRPWVYSPRRCETKTNPKGGICFRIQQENSYSYLTYSICHSEETFSKDVARRIADGRHLAGNGFFIPKEVTSTQHICDHIFQFCHEYEMLRNKGQSPREFYQLVELRTLCQRIEQIWASQRAIDLMSMMEHDVIEALNLRKMYEVRNG